MTGYILHERVHKIKTIILDQISTGIGSRNYEIYG
jgi:hypothetical protein